MDAPMSIAAGIFEPHDECTMCLAPIEPDNPDPQMGLCNDCLALLLRHKRATLKNLP